MKRSPLFRIAVSFLIGVVATLGSWLGLSLNIFGGSQLRFADALFPATDADPRVVVVGIDDESQAELGQWPFPRDVHARIIDNLVLAGADVIVYDVVFDPETPEDPALAGALRRANNVILAAAAEFPLGRPEGNLLVAEQFVPPVPRLADAAAWVAHANVTPDADSRVRSVPLVVDVDGELLPSLSLQALMAMENLEGPFTLRRDALQVGSAAIPVGEGQIMDLNFAEGLETEEHLSAAAVHAGDFDPVLVDGKTVFVGTTDFTLRDTRLTPVGELPGVFVHANALNTMLRAAYVKPADLQLNLAAVFAVAFAIAVIVQFLPMTLSWLAAIGLGVVYVLFAFQRADNGTIMNFVYPPGGLAFGFVGSLGVKYFTEVRERRRVTQTFGRYLAKDVVEEVLSSPEGAVATLKGALRPLSILFADLRGFTAASENAQPQEVVQALNVYLDAMTRAVVEERGTIDKFMGDCVMAFWGAPRPDPEYVDRAVRAGVKMLDYIDEAVRSNPATELLKVKGCGVGISSGMAVVGNIGSQERLDYTAIGDTVNTASRLCGVAEAGAVVVTEDTAAFMSEGFRLAPLPPLLVKGKVEPLKVFQVLREGQEAKEFAEGETIDSTEDKGHFEPDLTPVPEPPKAAGYAPVEPRSTKAEGSVIGPSESPQG